MRDPWKLTSLALTTMFVAGLGSSTPDVNADAQPKMHSALDHLRAAETALQNATHDKGGHRVKALAHTRQAIDQVRAGIKFDNRR
jgi:hypothetical protein